MFRIVLLEQMSTIPKVDRISLYAVLRGGPGQWGVQGLRANSANWQSVPAAVPGASPACCLSRTLRLESFVPKNCVLHLPLEQKGRLGRCCDHEQLGEALEGYWRAWRHGPACAGQMQASKLQPHQSGCSWQTEESPSTRTEPQILRSQGKLCPETAVQHEAENVGTQAAVSQSLETGLGSVQ